MSKSAQKILITAQDLFNSYSFVGVGVDLIRDTSGCSKTTMYTYFKNKNQLIEQVLKQRDTFFKQQLCQTTVNLQGKEALEKIAQWHLDWFRTDKFKGCLFVRAVAESTPEQHRIRDVALAHKQWLYNFILSFDPEKGDLFYCVLEGLISRFLIEGYSEKVARQALKKALT